MIERIELKPNPIMSNEKEDAYKILIDGFVAGCIYKKNKPHNKKWSGAIDKGWENKDIPLFGFSINGNTSKANVLRRIENMLPKEGE